LKDLLRLLIICFLAAVSSAALAEQRLVLATLENTPNGRIGSAVLKQAYAKIGIEVEIYPTSGKRALMLSSTGALDGEVVRFGMVGDLHPSLHRVDVPLVRFAVSVFVNKENATEDMIDKLSDLRVGHLTGTVRLVKLTREFGDVWQASSNGELFGMLAAGHLDAVVSDTVAGRIALQQLGLGGIGELGQPLFHDNLYHFLHEKHAHLVPRITETLQVMTRTGELKAVVDAEIKSMSGDNGEDSLGELN